jgi:hypothetical protein
LIQEGNQRKQFARYKAHKKISKLIGVANYTFGRFGSSGELSEEATERTYHDFNLIERTFYNAKDWKEKQELIQRALTMGSVEGEQFIHNISLSKK